MSKVLTEKDAHFQLLHFPSLVTWSLTFLLPWLLFAPWLCWDLRDLLIKENEDSSVQIKKIGKCPL